MVDFQFYRPQANALEQLWSQYAQAKGSTGGAFERGFVPGMMAGIEALQKKEAAKEERLSAQDFAKTQAEEARTFQKTEAEKEREFRIGEAAKERRAKMFTELATGLVETVGKNVAASTKAQADIKADDAKRLASETATAAYLREIGTPEDQIQPLAKQYGTIENATKATDDKRKAAEAAVQQQKREAEEKAQQSIRADINSTLDMLGSKDAPWSGALPKGLLAQYRARANTPDPQSLERLSTEVGSIGAKLGMVAANVDAYKAYESWAKKNQNQLPAGDKERLAATMREISNITGSIADRDQLAYWLATPAAFQDRIDKLQELRTQAENAVAGYGPEARFWEAEAEKGRAALRPESGKPVFINMTPVLDEKGKPIAGRFTQTISGYSPQMMAQLDDLARSEVRADPAFINLIGSNVVDATMLFSSDPEERKAAFKNMLPSEAERKNIEIEKLLQQAKERILRGRGFEVLNSVASLTDEEITKITDGAKNIFDANAKLRAAGYYSEAFDKRIADIQLETQSTADAFQRLKTETALKIESAEKRIAARRQAPRVNLTGPSSTAQTNLATGITAEQKLEAEDAVRRATRDAALRFLR